MIKFTRQIALNLYLQFKLHFRGWKSVILFIYKKAKYKNKLPNILLNISEAS